MRKNDFVLKRSEGVDRPAETIASYVVTSAIADALDQALGLVGSALEDGRSKGAYVHGSFGSGKSQSMAMLSLLLRNDPQANPPEGADGQPKVCCPSSTPRALSTWPLAHTRSPATPLLGS